MKPRRESGPTTFGTFRFDARTATTLLAGFRSTAQLVALPGSVRTDDRVIAGPFQLGEIARIVGE